MNRVIGELAHDFWKNAERSKLAPDSMYKKQHSILNTYILPYFESDSRLLDIGCSDGEFTQVLAKKCKEAVGVDLSGHLIDLAREKYGSSGKIKFQVLDLLKDSIYEHFDIISCMGVFTCLPKDDDFKSTVHKIDESLNAGGYLVVKDSLMLSGNQDVYYNDDSYEAIYRAEKNYLAEFEKYGYSLLQRHELHQGKNAGQVSVLYLFRKPPRRQKLLKSAVDGKMNVAILYQLPESWCNVESFWNAASNSSEVDCTIIVSPFLHQDIVWNKNKIKMDLAEKGIPFVFYDEIDVENSAFDVFLYTSPYDSTRPIPLAVDVIKNIVGSVAYVPYGLEVGGGTVNLKLQYAQPVALESSNIFVRSEGARDMFRKYCPAGDKHISVTGHPRMDRLFNPHLFNIDQELVQEIGNRKAVLWNPHFSFDQEMWSTFDIFSEHIFEFFSKQENAVLIFRPHPFLWKKLVNLNIISADQINELKIELRSIGVIVDEREDYRHSFFVSSVLMSDVSSFLMEFLSTSKPIIYLKNKRGLGLNDEGNKLVHLCYEAESKEILTNHLTKILDGKDELRQKRVNAIPAFFTKFDGNCGERVLGRLLDFVRKGGGWHA